MSKRFDRLILAIQSWEHVKQLHPKIRDYQNSFLSKLLGKEVALKPAEIRFGRLQHFLRGDYLILQTIGETNIIVIDSCYVKDYMRKQNLFEEEGISLDDYILGRVAEAEGTRSSNSLAWMSGLMTYEADGMMYVGELLGKRSVKAIGRKSRPVREEIIRAIGDPEVLKEKIVSDPCEIYQLVQEERQALA